MDHKTTTYLSDLICGGSYYSNSSVEDTIGLFLRKSCFVDVLSFSTNIVFAAVLTISCLSMCKDYWRQSSFPHLRYSGHEIRWMLTVFLIFFHVILLTEVFLTNGISDLSLHRWHTEVSAILILLLSLLLTTMAEKTHRGHITMVLFITWMGVAVVQSIRLANVIRIVGMSWSILRVDVLVLFVLSYGTLCVIDVVAYIQVTSDKSLQRRRETIVSEIQTKDIKYFHHYATLLTQATFGWMNSIFKVGKKRTLTTDDIGLLPDNQSASEVHNQTRNAFSKEKVSCERNHQPFSLTRILVSMSLGQIIFSAFLLLLSEICSYIQPLGVKGIIQYVNTVYNTSSQERESAQGTYLSVQEFFQNGAVLIGVMLVTQIIQRTLFEAQKSVCTELASEMKVGLMCMMYETLLSMSVHLIGSGEVTVGEITNLLVQDTFSLEQFFMQIHSSWSTPLRILVSMVLLYYELGPVSVIVPVIMLASIPIQFYLGKLTAFYKSKMMKLRDARIKRSSEMLHGIKYLKLSGWESSFYSSIQTIREEELKELSKMQTVFVIRNLLTFSVPVIVSVFLFATYSFFSGLPLTPDKAFFALVIIQQTQLPLTNFSLFFESLANTIVSVNRMNNFFKKPSLQSKDGSDINELKQNTSGQRSGTDIKQISQKVADVDKETTARISFRTEKTTAADNAIEIFNGHFTWGNSNNSPLLSDINLSFPKGKLTMIIGSVGSGKTSLLSAILGEMAVIKGNVKFSEESPRMALSSQKAWILNATLQDNVTLGRKMNYQRYHKIVAASGLDPDILMLPAGDQTEIGEKGINISGGQQQRVSIARALYSERDIVLLDDPLSALDVHVGKHVFENAIMDVLRKEGKTVILVTHQIQYLNEADQVILMENGKVKFCGTSKELISLEPNILITLKNTKQNRDFADDCRRSNGSKNISKGKFTKDSVAKNKYEEKLQRKNNQKHAKGNKKEKDSEKARLIQPEERNRGSVSWSVYWYFLVLCSFTYVLLVAGTQVLNIVLTLSSQFWLSAWSEASSTDTSATVFYVVGFTTLSFSGIAASGLATSSIVYTVFSAARKVHQRVVKNIIQLPIRFFDVTPVGRILNRLSSDTMQLDDMMVRWLEGFLSASGAVMATLITNIIIFPPIFLFFLPVGYFFNRILQIYLGPARDLKRLESTNRSPFLALSSETVNGLESIRAYRKGQDFLERFRAQVDTFYAVSLFSKMAVRWVTLRLAYLAACVFAATATLTTIASIFLGLHPSLVGLAITVSISMPNVLQKWMQTFAQLEIGMNAVERQKFYSEMETENYNGIQPSFFWLSEGDISVEGITVRYADHLDPVLRDVSFTVQGGQHVGICGRTGSGKSTLTLCMLRLLPVYEGRILIDGVDIATVPLTTLRQRVAIIPQDSTLFSGTVRQCLDMASKSNDAEIWRALEMAHMKNKILTLKAGLDSYVDYGGSNFSSGEKQLLCLARAIIRNSQIIIMDEATASVDSATDKLLRELVRKIFKNKTVVTVAHRLSSIMDADLIVVLSDGRIAEIDAPSVLLSRDNSVFATMVREGK